MRSSVTIVCCALLALFGATIGYNNPPPINTINAEPITLVDLQKDVSKFLRDTVLVTDTVRDTVKTQTIKYKTKYRVKRVSDTVQVEIPVLYTRTRGNRKEYIPDTILQSKPKVVRKVIELRE